LSADFGLTESSSATVTKKAHVSHGILMSDSVRSLVGISMSWQVEVPTWQATRALSNTELSFEESGIVGVVEVLRFGFESSS